MFGTKKQISFAADLIKRAESFEDRDCFIPEKREKISKRRIDLIALIRFIDSLENGLSGLSETEYASAYNRYHVDKGIDLLTVVGKAPSGKMKVSAEKVIGAFLHNPRYAISL